MEDERNRRFEGEHDTNRRFGFTFLISIYYAGKDHRLMNANTIALLAVAALIIAIVALVLVL